MIKTLAVCCILLSLVLFFLFAIWAISDFKKHDFEGKCLTCHVAIPGENERAENMAFTDRMDRLCAGCHNLSQQKSHPINVRPGKDMPFTAHLDKDGLVTCTTCHDVHKEDKTQNASELSGLLWGHTTGRAFCSVCHNVEALGDAWRHETAIPYAHPSYGKLVQSPSGSELDRYSVECLSCHDGAVSRSHQAQVRQGIWRHSIGDSHPIGAEYPDSEEFKSSGSLPKEVRLFDGKVGCLSCHEIYSKRKDMLVMDNRGSRLCLSCHKM